MSHLSNVSRAFPRDYRITITTSISFSVCRYLNAHPPYFSYHLSSTTNLHSLRLHSYMKALYLFALIKYFFFVFLLNHSIRVDSDSQVSNNSINSSRSWEKKLKLVFFFFFFNFIFLFVLYTAISIHRFFFLISFFSSHFPHWHIFDITDVLNAYSHVRGTRKK